MLRVAVNHISGRRIEGPVRERRPIEPRDDLDAWLEELDLAKCVSLLRANEFGRIAFIVDEGPIVIPVNYRLVETSGKTWIALRTRPGNVLDRAPLQVAFELDGASRRVSLIASAAASLSLA